MTSNSPFKRLSGFALIPVIGTITPLLVLPAITSTQGASGWAAVAIGQSIGGGASVLVELGWALTGPQLIARLDVRERYYTYILAHASKLIVFCLVGPVAAVIAFFLAPSHAESSAICALASAALGMSPIWFFIGSGQPSRILFADTLQRIGLTGVSAILLFQGVPLVVYASLSLLSAVLAPVLGGIWARSGNRLSRRVTFGAIVASFRAQAPALTGRSLSALYIAMPVAIVSFVSPSSVPMFAAAERLQRMGLGVLQSIPNSMQGWIGEVHEGPARTARIKRALLVNTGLGFVSGAAFLLLAPMASDIIFTGEATVSLGLSSICAFVICLSCISRATGGLALVAFGRVPTIAYSAATGAALGLVSIPVLGYWFGSEGAMVGEVIAESSVLVVQVASLRRAWR
jgi:O-antigen/teichoic acid export membrane protein